MISIHMTKPIVSMVRNFHLTHLNICASQSTQPGASGAFHFELALCRVSKPTTFLLQPSKPEDVLQDCSSCLGVLPPQSRQALVQAVQTPGAPQQLLHSSCVPRCVQNSSNSTNTGHKLCPAALADLPAVEAEGSQ